MIKLYASTSAKEGRYDTKILGEIGTSLEKVMK
jgi:hypothetical protein